MGFLRPVCVCFFFLGVSVYCQYESYQWSEDYDQESDDVYQPEFQFHQNVDYGVPYHQHILGCASECFCPANFPLSMYCDNRHLKVIPKIPAHIQQVYLQFNEIEAVTADSFANATNLKEINLSHNKIQSHKIDHGVFAKLSNLLQLDLQHNHLEEFPSPLPKSLERLLLGYNEISRVQKNAMDALPNLTMLDLCHNHLDDSTLKGNILPKTEKLMQLNLCHNRLESMPPGLPSSLMYLSLENNSISSIPENYFREIPKLHALRMSHNKLQDITHNIFNVSDLKELNVGHNRLKQAFYIPRNLEHLYLENNEIENINVSVMCPSIDPLHHHHLTYIRVDQNKLQQPISSYIFFCFPHIHTIYYGEQRSTNGQTIQLKTQVFRRFQDESDSEDQDDHQAGTEQEETEEESVDPQYYGSQEWQGMI
ncbi:osteomodulin [Erinaceus europaeus]|uniref:Osteomodulin n=1 Tax=Erinaceus europaeus TaxID=9365 RepID=A0A1S3A4M9_ERIEU|nr:osteomodulin [Erinaceus europaeus]XP_060056572.1 osteomodulin [Erinaceus europaeus]XP_060056573.1 osteomodulin [Erinaceus europaeus]XP_060056574.1 osteomodulin [Erinaceus europaeus]XP_060056575.1 osteomodulin [Erinaceus europaeus]XP_060056576.1 osteomodulin [Erinaceus europaeus]XP_060056577.1 osteomodulin [Erinaceus europaeus]